MTPNVGLYRTQFIDPDGPDRYGLLVNCLKRLEKTSLRSPSDYANALAISNLLAAQFAGHQMGLLARESVKFSIGLFPQISSDNEDLKEQTRLLINKYPLLRDLLPAS